MGAEVDRDEEKPKKARRRKRPDAREHVRLRESLGNKRDVALGLLRSPNFGKLISDADTLAQARVSYQPDITEPPAPEPQANLSRRWKRAWAMLTRLQKQAMRLVYTKNPERRSKTDVAHELEIRVDTLQERIDYAIKKLKRFFPEFGD